MRKIDSTARQSLTVTVYPFRSALVSDRRAFPALTEDEKIEIADICGQPRPESIKLDGLRAAEIDYAHADNNIDSVLGSCIGSELSIIDSKTGARTKGRLVLYNGHSQSLFRLEDGSLLLTPISELEIPAEVAEIRTTPSLTARVSAFGGGNVSLMYASDGLEWTPSYTAELSESTIELEMWGCVTNESSGDFFSCELRLMSGGSVSQDIPETAMAPMYSKRVMACGAPRGAAETEELENAHLYIVPGLVDLPRNHTKRLFISRSVCLSYKRSQVFILTPSSDHVNAQTILEAANTADNGLGVHLPEGALKVYMRDSLGTLEKTAESRIAETSKEETLTISLGRSQNVLGELSVIEHDLTDTEELTRYLFKMKNHSSQRESIIVDFNLPEGRIIETDHDYSYRRRSVVRFCLSLEAEAMEKLCFTVSRALSEDGVGKHHTTVKPRVQR